MDRTPHKPLFQKEGQPSDMSAEALPIVNRAEEEKLEGIHSIKLLKS